MAFETDDIEEMVAEAERLENQAAEKFAKVKKSDDVLTGLTLLVSGLSLRVRALSITQHQSLRGSYRPPSERS